MKKTYAELVFRILILIGLVAVLIFALKGMLGGLQMSKKNAQAEANKKWKEKNKERAKYLSDRSRTRSFIRSKATKEDLQELENLIKARREELNKQN